MNHNPNKRAYARIPVNYRVKVVTARDMVQYSLALNVSRGGILLAPQPALPLGAQVGVAIFLTDTGGDRRVVTRGIVLRSDGSGNAIRFIEDMDEASFEALARMVPTLDPCGEAAKASA
ncbi:MAG: PilZ domain-containing protein [Acidobacteria bacterium]|nr:PilZ domain-containing protein [Acidobacteriota bacterium]